MPDPHFNQPGRWALLGLLLLALILVPFLLFGDPIEAWTGSQLAQTATRPLTKALILGGLLAGDVLLPVPSSLVSTACGWLLGAGPGTLVSFVGMSLSCLFGYGLGQFCRPLAQRLIGPANARLLQQLTHRHGTWMILITRPIPVLAEAAVLVAGSARFSLRRFLAASLLANLAISAVYALLGHLGGAAESLLPAFGTAALLSLLCLLVSRRHLPHPPGAVPTRETAGDQR